MVTTRECGTWGALMASAGILLKGKNNLRRDFETRPAAT